jgi:GNAT superfamily N-acetyltransferase
VVHAASQFRVRHVAAADEAAWRRLWQSYCDFYGVAIPGAVTDTLWLRLMDGGTPIHALVAERAAPGEAPAGLVGFANFVLHPYTWGVELICYLEDLFVEEDARGVGVGTALIGALVQQAKENGWPRVYWHTHQLNEVARSVYGKITPPDPFVRYVVRVK